MRPKYLAIVAVTIAALALGGCATPAPLRAAQMRQPELRAIHAAFARAVEAAHADPELAWHSGWFGNVLVNLPVEGDRGLCHHWQEWIYQEVSPTVAEQQWEACGIAISVGTSAEHHAVLVFDPRMVSLEVLPYGKGITAAWVLDAWRRGRPDIYTLEDWLAIPFDVRVPAVLEDLSQSGFPPFNREKCGIPDPKADWKETDN